ncbi:MAG: FAD:protein FMN transferase [Candidatus Pacebacteria bacterium]|nr:FAD:protein FMN transferase [Candidatus Paceibacterota bacterium]
MKEFSFKGIGTRWNISIDDTGSTEEAEQEILALVGTFEKRFSRFLPDSEVNAFRYALPGVYEVSEEFLVLLTRADELRVLTGGAYDPAVGPLLEGAGYDASYRMQPDDSVEKFTLPEWEITQGSLCIDGPTGFDFGGIGKGYCIDRVSDLLKDLGFKYFIVEAGGDMYGTSKENDEPWKIAIEYPGKEDTAAGVVPLKDGAVAVSDSFRRRWGRWHHIVDPTKKSPVEDVIGAAVVAPSAWNADCMTSALFLSNEEMYASAAEKYDAAYLVFRSDGVSVVSKSWPGELFV